MTVPSKTVSLVSNVSVKCIFPSIKQHTHKIMWCIYFDCKKLNLARWTIIIIQYKANIRLRRQIKTDE